MSKRPARQPSPDPPDKRNIVLVGFMGSGKSAAGRLIAERTGRRFIDTDDLVEASGPSLPDIFAAEGEKGFRRREREAVRKASRAKGVVIATGGGAVLDGDNVRALKTRGVLVYLDVPEGELVKRLAENGNRPLLAPDARPARDERPDHTRRKRIGRLLSERRPAYEAVADHVVRCKGLDADAVADEVMRRVGVGDRSQEPPGFVEVGTDPPYRVWVGCGVLGTIADVAHVPEEAARVCVVSHPRVWRLWGAPVQAALAKAGLDVVPVTFPQGERRKSLDVVERIWRRLAQERFTRSDLLVALGGGVVGDVGGFAASTYARGIRFVQAPTTLLAMVDAAIGGKTGFNLPEGKNLVGTFAQPSAVVADLDTLTTLPDRELRGGLAEVAKYAFIADPDLGELARAGIDAIHARGGVLRDVVLRSAGIKASIVASDERESGIRAHLNYGHTLGHALEAASLGKTTARALHHGEAISVGMVFAAWVSVLCGMANDDLVTGHVGLLEALGLPTTTSQSWRSVAPYLEVDKKRSRELRLVLLSAPGVPKVHEGIPPALLEEAFSRVREG